VLAAGEAMVKCCGVAVAMPRGYSRMPTSLSDQSVNTGTFPVLPELRTRPACVVGLGPPSTDRIG